MRARADSPFLSGQIALPLLSCRVTLCAPIRLRYACAFLVLFILGLASAPLDATPPPAASAVFRSAHGRATLYSEQRAIRPGESLLVGLEIALDPEWHTYWKNPGDSGAAAIFQWDLPEGFSAGEILWPAPERIPTPPFMTYGFHGRPVLLVRLQAPRVITSPSVKIGLKAEWLECKEECIPAIGSFALELPATRGAAEAGGAQNAARERPALFTEALDRLPRNVDVAARAALDDAEFQLRLQLPAGLDLDESQVYAFVEQQGIVDHPAPQIATRVGDELQVSIPRDFDEAPGEALDVVLTLGPRAPGSAVLESWRVQAPLTSGYSLLTLLGALGAAFLGGLILNLMPCVLPALSLKVLAFVQHAGDNRRSLLLQAGAFSAGVLLSFWILAGALLAARALGETAGWGYQMQSPYFVFLLTILFALFALNLFGVFEVGLSFSRLGGAAQGMRPLAGAFVNGLLATLVATPCTAPFMGSALGFALQENAAVAFAIFTFLGLGMCAPYFLLAAFPRLLQKLPRPGPWMERLKEGMGFLMLAATLWLAWTLLKSASPNYALLALAAAWIAALGAWIYGAFSRPEQSRGVRLSAAAAGLALVLLAAGSGRVFGDIRASAAQSGAQSNPDSNENGPWRTWSPEAVSALRAEGRPVFVNFTADWCLSCKVNEALVFQSDELWDAMAAANIAALKADWTRRDPVIAQALASYGRAGVPLYIMYDRKGEARILSETLTPGEMNAEINRIREQSARTSD